MGGALRILGQHDEAIKNWEKALELDPSFAFAAYNLAVTYLEKGDKAKALENCQKYLLIRGRSITPEERNEIDALIKKIKG
ncbi:MAG: tetratricopeptide repeat protein [Candidatus Aminicenantes bacterium]|nr:tetratricopeptide repeat protein [Candidatus Aminicenantes bacterium]